MISHRLHETAANVSLVFGAIYSVPGSVRNEYLLQLLFSVML